MKDERGGGGGVIVDDVDVDIENSYLNGTWFP